MRKSRYGPLRCDRCGFVLSAFEQRILKAAHVVDPIHVGCMSPSDKARCMVKIGGTRCLFCGSALLLPDLMEHFNARHGRVVVNW